MAEHKETCPAIVFQTESADHYSGNMPGIRVVRTGCGVAADDGRISLLRPGAAMLIDPEKRPVFHLLTPVSFLDFYFKLYIFKKPS